MTPLSLSTVPHAAIASLLLAVTSPLVRAEQVSTAWQLDHLSGAGSAVDSTRALLVGRLDATTKFAVDGSQLWHQEFTIPGAHTHLTWLAVDSQDNVVRGGYHEGGDWSYVVVKYDPDGTLLWSTQLDVQAGEEAVRVAVDENDDIYVFGEANETFPLKRWLLVKVDASGQFQWHRWGQFAEPRHLVVRDGQAVVSGSASGGDFATSSYGYDGSLRWENRYQPGSSGANHVAIGPEGQVAVCGWGAATGGSGIAGTIVQYDAQGNQAWVAHHNSPGGVTDIFHRVAIDSEGRVVAVGYGLSSSPDDAWSILQLSSAGQLLWTRLVDEADYTGYEEATALHLGADDSIYVGGSSETLGSCGLATLEGQVRKYDPDGGLRWSAHVVCGGSPTNIHLDPRGGVYAVGDWQILRLEEPLGLRYCQAVLNSSNGAALISASGSRSLADADLVLRASAVPNQPFLFFHGPQPLQLPFGNGGYLCVGGTLTRILPPGIASGLQAEVTLLPGGSLPVATTLHFQC